MLFYFKMTAHMSCQAIHMSCHIVRHMSENRLYAQPKFQFDRKSRFIYRTYTHETKTRYMSRLSRYMSAWHDMCPTIPIYKPSFCLKMTNWYAILMTYTTYISHVGYMSCMSFIYRVFFTKIVKLSRHISEWLYTYRDIRSYVRPNK